MPSTTPSEPDSIGLQRLIDNPESAEELPADQSGGFGDRLHPPGDLGLRHPEHSLINVNARRPDGVQSLHGGGGDGHHGAGRFHVGLGADEGDAAAAVIPALDISPQVSATASERRNPPSDSTATRARSNSARSAACWGVSIPRPRAPGFRSGEADHGEGIGGEGAGLALGFGQTSSPSS